ncbi:putative transporter small subunit [Verticiella sediminum]|nr:putative transporter small subunit [Verticiella sediminum]
MNTTLLLLYILVWPALSAGILALLCVALWRDWREAKRTGAEMI